MDIFTSFADGSMNLNWSDSLYVFVPIISTAQLLDREGSGMAELFIALAEKELEDLWDDLLGGDPKRACMYAFLLEGGISIFLARNFSHMPYFTDIILLLSLIDFLPTAFIQPGQSPYPSCNIERLRFCRLDSSRLLSPNYPSTNQPDLPV